MTDMIERCARALATQAWNRFNRADRAFAKLKYPAGLDDYLAHETHLYMSDVRAVLLAAREPSNGMCVAGWRFADTRDAILGNGEVAMLWRAMIDEALKGDGNG